MPSSLIPGNCSVACPNKNKLKEKDETEKMCSHKWRKERCSSADANAADGNEYTARDAQGGRRSLPPKAPSATGRLQRDRKISKTEKIPKLSLPLEDETKSEEYEWCVPYMPAESASDSQVRKCHLASGLQRTTLTYSETLSHGIHVGQKMDVRKAAGESPTKKLNVLLSGQSKSALNSLMMSADESCPTEYDYDDLSVSPRGKDNSASNEDSSEMKSLQESSTEEHDISLNAEDVRHEKDNSMEMESESHQVLHEPNNFYTLNSGSVDGNISSVEENDMWTRGEASDSSCCSLSQEESDADDINYFSVDPENFALKQDQCNQRHAANSPFKRLLMQDFNTSRSEPIFSAKPSEFSEQSPLFMLHRSTSLPTLPHCHHEDLKHKWAASTANGELFFSCNAVQLLTILAFVFFAYFMYLHYQKKTTE